MTTFYKGNEIFYKVKKAKTNKWMLVTFNTKTLTMNCGLVEKRPTDLGKRVSSNEWDKALLDNFEKIKFISL